MKALSIKQPWAELIICGDKRVENRIWNSQFRGKFAVHASVDQSEVKHFNLVPSQFKYGAIIGTVEMIDCVRVTDQHSVLEISKKYPWFYDHEYVEGPYCFILQNAVRFSTPIYIKGALKFWEWNSG